MTTRNSVSSYRGLLLCLCCLSAALSACNTKGNVLIPNDSETGLGPDTDVDGDADTDTDSDADGDGDSDNDTDVDADADTDTDSDGDGDGDSDNDTDTDTDVDADTDTDADGDSDNDTDVDTDTDSDGDSDSDMDTDTDSDGDTDSESVQGPITFSVVNVTSKTQYIRAPLLPSCGHLNGVDWETCLLDNPGCTLMCDTIEQGQDCCLDCVPQPSTLALDSGESARWGWDGKLVTENPDYCGTCSCYDTEPPKPGRYKVGVCAYDGFECLDTSCEPDQSGLIAPANPTGTKACFEVEFDIVYNGDDEIEIRITDGENDTDTETDSSCVEAGGLVPVIADPPECCAGLKLIAMTGEYPDCIPLPGAELCADCPNGTCETDYEDFCNCPQDCPEPAEESGECSETAGCIGGECVRVPDLPGGYWTCVYPPAEPVTKPSENPLEDECTSSADCGEECDCFLFPELYSGFYFPHNECVCDECDADSDCPDSERQVCVPAGASWGGPLNQCKNVLCRTDADCTADALGQCTLFRDPCSSQPTSPSDTKYCRYPSDPCFADEECSGTYELCLPSYSSEASGFSCRQLDCPGK